MKALLAVLWLVSGVAYGQNTLLVKNQWTNSLVLQYTDANVTAASVEIPVGQVYQAVLGGSQSLHIVDLASFDGSTGLFGITADIVGDGSTNDMVVLCQAGFTVVSGSPDVLVCNMTASSYQYPGAIYDYSGRMFTNGHASVGQCIHMWFYGVCTAVVLGLSGASRRLLAMVHEVRSDI